jgi:hypothetical protein
MTAFFLPGSGSRDGGGGGIRPYEGRLDWLEQQVAKSEELVEGPQDAVHRESVRSTMRSGRSGGKSRRRRLHVP